MLWYENYISINDISTSHNSKNFIKMKGTSTLATLKKTTDLEEKWISFSLTISFLLDSCLIIFSAGDGDIEIISEHPEAID